MNTYSVCYIYYILYSNHKVSSRKKNKNKTLRNHKEQIQRTVLHLPKNKPHRHGPSQFKPMLFQSQLYNGVPGWFSRFNIWIWAQVRISGLWDQTLGWAWSPLKILSPSLSPQRVNSMVFFLFFFFFNLSKFLHFTHNFSNHFSHVTSIPLNIRYLFSMFQIIALR